MIQIDTDKLIEKYADKPMGESAPPTPPPAAPSAEPKTEAPPTAAPAPDSPESKGQTEQSTSQADPAQRPKQADETFEIVVNGETVKLSRADLVAHAQKGFDYTKKTQGLAQKAREFEELVTQYDPWLKKAQEIQERERSLSDDDPIAKANRTAEEAKSMVARLAEDRQREALERQQADYLNQVYREVTDARGKHAVLKNLKPKAEAAFAKLVGSEIRAGLSPTDAVASAAAFITEIQQDERNNFVKGKVEDATKSPVPKAGAPAPSKVVVHTAKDFHSGAVADAALRRLQGNVDRGSNP